MSLLPDPATPLSEETAEAAFHSILADDIPDADIARFLVALSERGETVGEIVAAARVLRRHMLPIAAPAGTIDVCGTGGDGANTRNISTAVAFVVAGAGVRVAKHGNRAASSRSGATDVLQALGWQGDLPFARLEAELDEIGIVFLHAPRHHPALARVAAVRRALGRRTIFNIIGPLANPARVTRQIMGVFAPHWVHPIAEALATLGSDRAFVVHGSGLDELTVHGASMVTELDAGTLRDFLIEPVKAGLPSHPEGTLAGGTPEENAAALRALFAGDIDSPDMRAYRDIVLLNAAAALLVAGEAQAWPAAVRRAADALDSGAAADKLSSFLAFR